VILRRGNFPHAIIFITIELERGNSVANLRGGYCERASERFWPPAPLIVEILRWSRPTMRPNKQRFELSTPPSEARRTKKKARDQVGPRRVGVRGGEIDHKADDRAGLVIAPQNALAKLPERYR